MKQNIYDEDTFYQEYKTMRESGTSYNDFIEQPALRAALGDPGGKDILDLGCGAGAFAYYCAANKAKSVRGIDISSNMINQARMTNHHENIIYEQSSMEDCQLPAAGFDMAVSSLAMHYIKNYSSIVEKTHTALRHGGIFIFTMEHPYATARRGMGKWIKDKKGNKLYWALDNYQEEGKREQHWVIDGVIKYHRTISSLMNTLIASGFLIEEVQEPKPTAEGLEKQPKLCSELRKPSFLLIKSRKKGES
ncbi:class I SAM-dependent methyltransferase [Alteribacillus sp. HJP-4]|uniref:class I SAM-dependent methyltransferase n=1 Tax=Alteribacillus sp. HJP-4 TaxID=2775394 RepID=UPI0035CCD59C